MDGLLVLDATIKHERRSIRQYALDIIMLLTSRSNDVDQGDIDTTMQSSGRSGFNYHSLAAHIFALVQHPSISFLLILSVLRTSISSSGLLYAPLVIPSR
jgi:hypothetical protein